MLFSLSFPLINQDAKAKAVIEDAKKPEQATVSDADDGKGKYQRADKKKEEEDEKQRQLKMGKGKIPDNKDDGENVKLKPIPEKQVNFIKELLKRCSLRKNNFNYDIFHIKKIIFTKNSSSY